jgi:lipoyl(octanoyl) transferase
VFRAESGLLESPSAGSALQTYVLGVVDYEEALALQRRLVYEVSGGASPALILCEHPPLLTIGRHGSHAHITVDERELALRGWRKRWVNRGGGCWLHLPGQIAIYPIIPLKSLNLGIATFLRRLQQAMIATFADFTVEAQTASAWNRSSPGPDVWAGRRPIACLGVAVRDWVTYHGAIFNLNPDLEWFRGIHTGKDHPVMTSLERERRGPVRPGMVRQRLLEHLAERLGFGEMLLFTEHPRLGRKAQAHAIAAAR